MSSSMTYQPHNILANIPYWLERDDDDPPAVEQFPRIMLLVRHVDLRIMNIYDIRGSEDSFTLDTYGFQLWTLPEVPEYTIDGQDIEQKQYPQIMEALRKVTGGFYVCVFSHIIRDTLNFSAGAGGPHGKEGSRSPAKMPHTDFHIDECPSIFSSRPQLARHITSGRRWQIIGVWRPLKTIQRSPLALLDARTTSNSDLVKIKRDYGSRVGAASVLKHSDGLEHKWYYIHEQQPNEAWLFKHYDSLQENGIARQCAHTSFEIPGTFRLPPRESIEFRALVLY